jgi:A1 cistron-splicing factor AAR2
MHAVGSYPLGTLRVHSPSPPRESKHDYGHDLLRSGDVIIMSNIPTGSLLGVDTKAFEIQTRMNLMASEISQLEHISFGEEVLTARCEMASG